MKQEELIFTLVCLWAIVKMIGGIIDLRQTYRREKEIKKWRKRMKGKHYMRIHMKIMEDAKQNERDETGRKDARS